MKLLDEINKKCIRVKGTTLRFLSNINLYGFDGGAPALPKRKCKGAGEKMFAPRENGPARPLRE